MMVLNGKKYCECGKHANRQKKWKNKNNMNKRRVIVCSAVSLFPAFSSAAVLWDLLVTWQKHKYDVGS